MKIRIHNSGTIVCLFNKQQGFAISIGPKDPDVILGKLDDFNFYKYPEIWVEI